MLVLEPQDASANDVLRLLWSNFPLQQPDALIVGGCGGFTPNSCGDWPLTFNQLDGVQEVQVTKWTETFCEALSLTSRPNDNYWLSDVESIRELNVGESRCVFLPALSSLTLTDGPIPLDFPVWLKAREQAGYQLTNLCMRNTVWKDDAGEELAGLESLKKFEELREVVGEHVMKLECTISEEEVSS
ncbi:hypothetical protein BV25DRAFT_383080 [Artomyces pyxidatus]|uniref:Uncharacterized protein n=1 Tax=Artomyces pyxidatus TaxID=48021 RepID=A0ACB8T5Y6_9AGAM|nr:hypothetical protein BV25DRAFT_383080 [Artomyces pyxidatus]